MFDRAHAQLCIFLVCIFKSFVTTNVRSWDTQKPNQGTCFMCRKYYTKYSMSQWQCPYCGITLCQKNRCLTDKDRIFSCYEEHLNSPDLAIRCVTRSGCAVSERPKTFSSHLKLPNPKKSYK